MKKLLSIMASVALLFAFGSCSLINGNGGWGSAKTEKNQAEKSTDQKLTVSFSCQDISRASLAPDALSFSDITKIELTARKLIEEDGSSDFEDYIFDASSAGASTVKTWISGISETSSGDTSVVVVDQGASANTSDGQATLKTAYQKMTSDSVEMDLGSYIFSIKLYTGGLSGTSAGDSGTSGNGTTSGDGTGTTGADGTGTSDGGSGDGTSGSDGTSGLSGDTGTSDFRLTLTGTLGSQESPYRLTKAEILTFETAYVETGKLSLTFEWKLPSIKSDRIGKIEAGLFTMESKGSSALAQDGQDFDFEELEILTLSSGSGSEAGGTSAGSGTSADGNSGTAGDSGLQDSIITYSALYQKDEVPNGTYFLKYRLYDSRGNLVLNSLMSLVKIHGWKTENTIEIDPENINSLPEAGNNFVVDDKRVYFEVEQEGKLYLNNGNVSYRAYQINSNGEEVDLPSDTISAMLFYRGQEVSGSFFKTDSSEGKIVLGQDSSDQYACLPKGGTYQVYIMIFNPTNSVLASDYYDIEVEDYEYYRYSLESQTSFIRDDATKLFPENTAFYNLESDLKKLEHKAIIEIYGNPDASLEENEDYKGTIEHNGESLSYIKGFYSALSSILNENYVFDIYLDLSELGDKLCVIDRDDC
ncbi:MAG: hypothetical protein K6E78_08690, partial [Treponema sp.]|nr:hypothetical protein [Treponema sp.]